MPRVSVVIPTNNRAALLRGALDSVLAQTYRDFEVVVVDDGSTDETPDLLSGYGAPVRSIRKPHQGLSEARNAAIRASQGQLIAFLDSDDLWTPTKLERQIELFDEDPTLGLVYCDAEIFECGTGRVLGLYSWTHPPHEEHALAQLFLCNFIPTLTVVVPRKVFDEIGGFCDAEWVAPDFDMWLRIAARYRIRAVREPLARRRKHAGMITHSWDWQRQLSRRLTAIERAVKREPQRLACLQKQAEVNRLLRMGRSLSSEGRLSEARTLFFRAIRLQPHSLLPYAHWIGSLAGARCLGAVARLRHMVREGQLADPTPACCRPARH
ncbi:glycosyltransferase family 2 protein [Planctomycetota bacterium]